MKGMGTLLVGVGALVVAGLYLAGRLPGFGTADTLPDPNASQAATQAADAGMGFWTWLTTQPWGWTSIGAAIGATIGVMTWRRIGGWGRGFVLVAAAVAVTAVVTR